jgi:hypothetical protein
MLNYSITRAKSSSFNFAETKSNCVLISKDGMDGKVHLCFNDITYFINAMTNTIIFYSEQNQTELGEVG